MKKIIKNKVYDTSTAKSLGEFTRVYNLSTTGYEELYQKKTGEYFLFIQHYPKRIENALIKPMTYEEAREWAEKHLDCKEYISIFGDPEENAEKTVISISIRKDTHEKLKRLASKSGKTVSEYIEGLI